MAQASNPSRRSFPEAAGHVDAALLDQAAEWPTLRERGIGSGNERATSGCVWCVVDGVCFDVGGGSLSQVHWKQVSQVPF